MKNTKSTWNMMLFWCLFIIPLFILPEANADIDVEMMLNDGGFVSFNHFKAELYLNNHDALVPDAWIFGILEVAGEYYYWPDFGTEVNYREFIVVPGETSLTFLEFDFPDIDDFIPFGPIYFWGAWLLDLESWGYDVREFWLDNDHKWTPTPLPVTNTPTNTPFPNPGALYSTDPIVGNMRYVPSGSFTQGSPVDEPCRGWDETQFTHLLTKNIAVMETEITRQMWADLRAVQPTLPEDPSSTSFSPLMINPVQRIMWYESVLFANLLSVQNGYTRCYYKDATYTISLDETNYLTGQFFWNPAANGYRLPSEGEWEYFCRAGTSGPFSCDQPDYNSGNCYFCSAGTHEILEQYCVYCANDPNSTQAVGSKLPNPWNLKDVHGNVWEWCWDWYASYPSVPVTDYSGPGTGLYRVRRSGGWTRSARYCRSADRLSNAPNYWSSFLGFRLLRTVP